MRTLVVLLLVAAVGAAEESLWDWSRQEPGDGWRLRGVRSTRELTVEGRGRAVRFEVGGRASARRAISVRDWRGFGALVLELRVEADAPVPMRVLAHCARAPAKKLCRFTVEPGAWRAVELPLADWRDDTTLAVADFDDLRVFEVRWEGGAGAVTLGAARLLPGSCRPTDAYWLELAFPESKGRAYAGESFVVYTDVRRGKPAARLEEGLAVLRERYGVDGEMPSPAPLFVFRDVDDYRQFFVRLGERYKVGISPPKSSGYAVLGVAASSWSKKYRWDRPVFVHEAMHAAVHRLVGIASNSNWLHETLAVGVQVRLYPDALATKAFPRHCRKLAAGRDGFFVPLEHLLTQKRTPMKRYGQLYAFAEYLHHRHRKKLPALWAAFRAAAKSPHESAAAVIQAQLGLTLPALTADFAAWGQAHKWS